MTSPHLASLEADGWAIDDGEVAHAKSPETYPIPSKAARESLELDSLVKIRFYIRAPDESGNVVDHGERMWVLVKERRDGCIVVSWTMTHTALTLFRRVWVFGFNLATSSPSIRTERVRPNSSFKADGFAAA